LPVGGADRKIEQMNDDLLSRLRRLGVTKGVRNLQPTETPQSRADLKETRLSDHQPGLSIETLFPGGYLSENQAGRAFIVDHAYPTHYIHGSDRLAELLNFSPATAAHYIHDNRLEESNFRDFVFLDTETTGLAGAGTLAFMVGVGFFESRQRPEGDLAETGAFVVRQFFLRDHEDEPAMLQFLDELLADKAGLITFNGRTFDLPLLNNRYLMNRLSGQLMEMPHIDLLPPSRRLWKSRLGSCALGSLEQICWGCTGLMRTFPDGLFQRFISITFVRGMRVKWVAFSITTAWTCFPWSPWHRGSGGILIDLMKAKRSTCLAWGDGRQTWALSTRLSRRFAERWRAICR
jgi:hypothetical protein